MPKEKRDDKGHVRTHWISRHRLPMLHEYKYAAYDGSLISANILQPYWCFLARFIPRCIAPNVLTLLGLLCTVAAYIAVAWYEGTTVPSWVYLFCAVMVFAYQTLDALDGKQARATGMSGPLGELFDHGCDSLNLTFTYLLSVHAIGIPVTGNPWIAGSLATMALGFFTSAWEQFHTGVLYLPLINGPVEGTLIAVATMLWSAWAGVESWSEPVLPASVCPSFLVSLVGRAPTRADTLFAVGIAAAMATIAGSLAKIAQRVVARSRERDAGRNWIEHYVAVVLASTQALPVFLFCCSCVAWFVFSPDNILANHPHVALIGFGFGVAHFTDRVMLAHLLKNRSPSSPWWLVFMAGAGAANAVAMTVYGAEPSFPETRYLVLFSYVAVTSYLVIASFVVRDITNYLGIHCFTVPSTSGPKKKN